MTCLRLAERSKRAMSGVRARTAAAAFSALTAVVDLCWSLAGPGETTASSMKTYFKLAAYPANLTCIAHSMLRLAKSLR